jgi:hypothetical protein
MQRRGRLICWKFVALSLVLAEDYRRVEAGEDPGHVLATMRTPPVGLTLPTGIQPKNRSKSG